MPNIMNGSNSVPSRKNKRANTQTLAVLAVLASIQIVLSVTPLGYIPLGVTRATTVHIPVIIGAILFGPYAGAFLGGVFGLTSFISNTINPTITSFVFTPFFPLPGETHGSLWSLVICFVPRILIGVVSGYVYKTIENKSKPSSFLSLGITGIIGSLVNTLLVMFGIYIFFGTSYSSAKDIDPSQLMNYILGSVIAINGVLEAIVAGVLVGTITKPLMIVKKQINRR